MTWELNFLYSLQEMHSPVLDKIMVFFSTLGNAGLFWIAISLILLIIPKTRKIGLHMGLAITITYIFGNLVLKNLVARQRPYFVDPNVTLLIKKPSEYSFPSGHSMNGFAAATSLFLNNKKWGIPALIVASIIAFSRLYNFVHWPTDVICGILLGILNAIIVYYLLKKFWKEKEA